MHFHPYFGIFNEEKSACSTVEKCQVTESIRSISVKFLVSILKLKDLSVELAV